MTDTKNVKYYDNLAVASSPHLVTALDTQKTMMWVLIALIPSFIASVFYFGLGAVILTAVCAASSVLFEWGYERLLGKKVTVKDLSACVTGVILAMNLPANLPVWMAVIGCSQRSLSSSSCTAALAATLQTLRSSDVSFCFCPSHLT